MAAGRGTRVGAGTAKAFLDLAGTPMAVYALRTLTRIAGIESIVLVIASDQEVQAREIIRRFGPWPLPLRLVPGGAERQDSVAAGLGVVPALASLVLVHDAARPFVSATCVQACIDAAATHGAAIAAVAAHDTVKLAGADGVIVETLDRGRVWLAQTPQVFRTALLREAYANACRDGYLGTDDASLVERLGHPVRIVPGEPTNRKITTPDDLQWAEWYLQVRGSPTAAARL
ncbi:MAG TPA: 2-C-methyl-D-erythritol 4-phosphate cytidylyltransferase [Candidatus Margulisiibacteriota bacterium]|nr:2-C-methyl-D-erythritol 4-phosphate cytidylyltransferase [Candidatus Margulisiibacteriota bacterium]